jgi:hypothetical protein
MEAEFQGVSSQTGRIKTTRKGVSLYSDDASTYMTALSMSSGSYPRLAIHELIHWERKELSIVLKTASSGNAEQ